MCEFTISEYIGPNRTQTDYSLMSGGELMMLYRSKLRNEYDPLDVTMHWRNNGVEPTDEQYAQMDAIAAELQAISDEMQRRAADDMARELGALSRAGADDSP